MFTSFVNGLMAAAGASRQPLIVFIHGFMGSSESFKRFPEDLQEMLSQSAGLSVAIKNYEFETHGSNEERVSELVAWLLQYASASQYSPVIVCGHSMGGLLAVDAARALLDNRMKGPTSMNADVEVNIRAVFAFDSPFFGLHPNVILEAGAEKVKQKVETVAGFLSKVMPPAQTTRSGTSTMNASSSSSGGGWGSALGMLAVAGLAGYAASQHPEVQRHLQRSADTVRGHLEFLGPLWKVTDQDVRFLDLTTLQNSMAFRCFYQEVRTIF
jgi:pimeloyl-ACP methyl ester carboxylesterase